jgi:pyruvate/2-oxoglutarate dehydrogenase complex dihydrolipoamide dehydrogenase (E3) component
MLCVDVYGHEQELPHEIVVIGGSETGTETGMHLAEKGHHVTVMTRQGMLAADAPHAHYVVMMMDAYEKLPNFDYVRYLQKYEKVDPKGVTYIDRDGKEQFLPADLVVLSGGVEPVPEACARFYGSGDHVHYIGDCYRAGDVHKAVTAGWATANQI